jgi:hypothetical protein
MAVYQGARYRTPPLPFGAQPVTQRRVGRVPVQGRTRIRPVTMVLAGILVAFLLGLVYLTQTLQAGVANYQIDNLMIERRNLQQELQSELGEAAQWGNESQVVEWAAQQGLTRLGGRIRVPAK